MLRKTNPQNFSDLVKISGLSHGTDVWLGDGEGLVERGLPLAQIPALRDDVMLDFINVGTNEKLAYDFSEIVCKGMIARNKVDKNRLEKFRRYCNRLGDWYFDFCSKVKYMFPKAHAVSYAINAVRCAYFKIYHPAEFYAAYFSTYFDSCELDYGILLNDCEFIQYYIEELSEENNQNGSYTSSDEYEFAKTAEECFMRGINFLPPDKEKSHPQYFLPEDGNIRLPFFEWE